MSSIGYVTCASEKEAEKIARVLLEKRLIACANIAPGIKSLYWWKGKVEKSQETLLLLKTTKQKQERITKEIGKAHSYELPCIEFFEAKANKKCEKWISEETK